MNITNLLADTNFLCGSTSGTYPTNDKIRNFNVAYNDVARIIWESSSTIFDDSNATDGPIAYVTLGHASASYLLPTTAIRIRGIEVRNKDDNWCKLTPITYEDIRISPEEYLSTAGMPLHYQLEGNEVRLYPKPSSAYCDLATAMAFRLERNVTEIATTATTTSPGFPAPFHRILSYAASIDFTQDENQRRFYIAQKDRLEKGLRNFYAKKAFELPATIKPAGRRNWQKYI